MTKPPFKIEDTTLFVFKSRNKQKTAYSTDPTTTVYTVTVSGLVTER